jgi:hypothetical protein
MNKLDNKPNNPSAWEKKYHSIHEHRYFGEKHFKFVEEKFIVNMRTVFLTLRNNNSKNMILRKNRFYLGKLLVKLYYLRKDAVCIVILEDKNVIAYGTAGLDKFRKKPYVCTFLRIRATLSSTGSPGMGQL